MAQRAIELFVEPRGPPVNRSLLHILCKQFLRDHPGIDRAATKRRKTAINSHMAMATAGSTIHAAAFALTI